MKLCVAVTVSLLLAVLVAAVAMLKESRSNNSSKLKSTTVVEKKKKKKATTTAVEKKRKKKATTVEKTNAVVVNNVTTSTTTARVKTPRSHDAASINATTTTTQRRRIITMIVKVRGALGNHLGFLAQAYAHKLSIERQFPTVEIKLVGESFDPEIESELRACFPSLANFEFASGKFAPYFTQREQEQKSRIDNILKANTIQDTHLSVTHPKTLMLLSSMLEEEELELPGDASISLPYLTSDTMIHRGMLEKYLKEIRDFLRLDLANPHCCRQTPPSPDDIVIHIRHFTSNLRKRGYHEMGPLQMATELVPNVTLALHNSQLNDGRTLLADDDEEKLSATGTVTAASSDRNNNSFVIVSRYHKFAQPYREALMEQGYANVRIHTKNSATQDFCYLHSTQRALVGIRRSTFVKWSIWLMPDSNKCERFLYAMDSRFTRKVQRKVPVDCIDWEYLGFLDRLHCSTYKA